MSEEAEYEVDLGSFEDDASKQVAANVAMFVSGWEEADRSPAAPNAPVNDPDSPPGGMDALAADVEKEFDTISPGVRGEEGAGDEGDEVAGSAVSGRSAPSGESTWPILNALKLIQKVYQDKIKADATDDAMNNARQNMKDYMSDWFINQYGFGPARKDARARFVATLKKHKDTNPYCSMFGRLWGVFEPLEEAWCDFYLEWLTPLIEARASKDEIVIPVKHGMAYMVLLSHLAEVIRTGFADSFDSKQLSDLLTRLAAVAEPFGGKGRKYVDQEVFLGLILEEKRSLLEAAGETLEPVSDRRRKSDRPVKAVLKPDLPPPVEVKPVDSGEPTWPILNALKLIQKVYQDKIKADATDDSVSNARQNMKDYMSDWFINQYGFGPARKDARARFVATLKKHKDTNPYCSMFGRLWGVFEPLEEAWSDFYLEWLTPLIEARASKDEIVIPVKHGMAYMVLLSQLAEVVRTGFSGLLDSKQLTDLLTRLAAVAEPFGGKGRKYVDQEVFLGLILEEKRSLLEAAGETLEAVSASRLPKGSRPLATAQGVSDPLDSTLYATSRRAVSVDRFSAERVHPRHPFVSKSPEPQPRSLSKPPVSDTSSREPSPEPGSRITGRSSTKPHDSLWPLLNTLKLIQKVYQDKIKADVTDDSFNNARQNMKDYMSDWFINQYGFGPARKDARARFVATLKKHKDTNPYCSMFGRLWGVFEPLEEAWCDFYLEWLTPLIEARASKDEHVIPVKHGMAYMVLLSHLAEVIRTGFGGLLDAKQLSDLLTRLAAVAEPFGGKGRKYVDQEVFLGLILEEKRSLLEAAGEKLEAVSESRRKGERHRRGVSLDRASDPSSAVVTGSSANPTTGSGRSVATSARAGLLDSVSESTWPILNALKLIQKVYQDKIKADATDDSLHNARQNMKDYMSDWFINQYGFGPARKDARARLVATLKKHKDSNAYCFMFGRLWGVFEPLEEAWCDFYLEWLTPLIEARASKDEIVIPVKHGMAYMVLVSYLVDVVRQGFNELLDSKQIADMLARLFALSEPFGGKGRKYVDQERFLTFVLAERPLPSGQKRPNFPVITLSTGAMRAASPYRSTLLGDTLREGARSKGTVIERNEEFVRNKERKLGARLEAAQSLAMADCTFKPQITRLAKRQQSKVALLIGNGKPLFRASSHSPPRQSSQRPGNTPSALPPPPPPSHRVVMSPEDVVRVSVSSNMTGNAQSSPNDNPESLLDPLVPPEDDDDRYGFAGPHSPQHPSRVGKGKVSYGGSRESTSLAQRKAEVLEAFVRRQAIARQRAAEAKVVPHATGTRYKGVATVPVPFNLSTRKKTVRSPGRASSSKSPEPRSPAGYDSSPTSASQDWWSKFSPLVSGRGSLPLVSPGSSPLRSSSLSPSAAMALQAVGSPVSSPGDNARLSQKLQWAAEAQARAAQFLESEAKVLRGGGGVGAAPLSTPAVDRKEWAEMLLAPPPPPPPPPAPWPGYRPSMALNRKP